jgi:hypothetical protein
MGKRVSTGVLVLMLAALAGCCCNRGEVPVSFEPFCNWLRYHGPNCRHYPNSCPCCPYWDYECHVWRAPDCEPCPAASSAAPAVKDETPKPRVAPTVKDETPKPPKPPEPLPGKPEER